MPAVSKKQQKYFGYLLSNPEERKKKGISKKAAKDFAQDIQEVSPPGWGHTKAEKEKTKPWKPKSKIGGSAAAFKRALDDGRFKGLPGSTTKKEKTADMFKLMWSMKKKGDKPHYKPGTDEKKKKYQKEEASQYEKLKKKIGSKKMHDKPVTVEDVEYTYPNVRRNRRFSTGSKMSMNPTGGIGKEKSTKNNPAGDDIRNATYNDIKSMERKKEARRRILASKMVGGVVKKKSVKEEQTRYYKDDDRRSARQSTFHDFYKKAKAAKAKKQADAVRSDSKKHGCERIW